MQKRRFCVNLFNLSYVEFYALSNDVTHDPPFPHPCAGKLEQLESKTLRGSHRVDYEVLVKRVKIFLDRNLCSFE